MGISSSKRKTRTMIVEKFNISRSPCSTIEEVNENIELDSEKKSSENNLEESDRKLFHEEKVEQISDNVPELLMEVNMFPELTKISKIPDSSEIQSLGSTDFVKCSEIQNLRQEIEKLKKEREYLNLKFTDEYKTKLAEIHEHLQKRLDFLHTEVEANTKAKYEASLKSYEVQMKILEKKNKILQDL